MKKILLCLMLGFMVTLSYAQDDGDSNPYAAGTINLNAGSNLNISFADGTPYILSIGGGYFLMDNLMAGASFVAADFGFGSDTSFGLNARYYVYGNLYGGASYNFDAELFSLNAGYDIFLSDRIALTPTFTYHLEDGYDPEITASFNLYF